VVQNVLYYKVITDDPDGDNKKDLADVFTTTAIVAQWRNRVSNEVSFACLNLQTVFPLTEVDAAQEFDVSEIGSQTLESLPAMDSVLMQKVNNLTAGVGKKGRIYIVGLPEAHQEFGRMLDTIKSAWITLADVLGDELAAPSSGVYKPAWATRSSTTPFPIDGDVEIDKVTLLPRLATQRRRRTPIRAFAT